MFGEVYLKTVDASAGEEQGRTEQKGNTDPAPRLEGRCLDARFREFSPTGRLVVNKLRFIDYS